MRQVTRSAIAAAVGVVVVGAAVFFSVRAVTASHGNDASAQPASVVGGAPGITVNPAASSSPPATRSPAADGTPAGPSAAASISAAAHAAASVPAVRPPSTTAGGCASGGTVAPCIGSVATAASGWGAPVFDDEFSGTSVDTSNWQTSCPDWNGGLNGGNVAANVSENGGALVLTESSAGKGACVETSSYVKTSGFRLSGYGYAEARVSFPGNSLTVYDWPAWWLVGANDGTVAPNNATGDETDIAEGLHGTLKATQHNWHTSGCGISDDNDNGCQQQLSPSGSYAGSYHIFGIDREPGQITVYYDGKSIGTLKTNDGGKPVWLVLNIGDGQFGGPKMYGASSTMKVDYVRVWQKR